MQACLQTEHLYYAHTHTHNTHMYAIVVHHLKPKS
jgi:hypothetical protein